MANTFLTSDWHVGHENILHLCHRDEFKNITECEARIRANHNALVSDSARVYNLGDVGFRCSPQHVVDFLSSLNGKHIIILGNHEKPLRQAYRMGLLKNLLNSGKVEIIGGEMAIEDSTISISKTITIDGQTAFISHYPHTSYPGSFRGWWMCHGHCHHNLKPKYKIMDIGVDTFSATHPRYTPYSWQEIKTIMDNVNQPFSET